MRGRRLGFAVATAIVFLGLFLVPLQVNRNPGPQARPGGSEPVVPLRIAEQTEPQILQVEEYIAGVVAAEMGGDFPVEALAAQAIIARTYTMQEWLNKGRPVEATDQFQVYRGDLVTDKIREAVERTRGIVMTYKGEPAEAYYHSCAGGKTATASEAFGGPDRAYLKPVPEEPCEKNDSWQATFTLQEVEKAAGVKSGGVVKIAKRGPSGRTVALRVGDKEISAWKMRAALGSKRMRSTMLLSVQVKAGKVEVRGRGWGHGVGMSQWGAKARAEGGAGAGDIIQYYYPGITLEKWW